MRTINNFFIHNVIHLFTHDNYNMSQIIINKQNQYQYSSKSIFQIFSVCLHTLELLIHVLFYLYHRIAIICYLLLQYFLILYYSSNNSFIRLLHRIFQCIARDGRIFIFCYVQIAVLKFHYALMNGSQSLVTIIKHVHICQGVVYK